MNIENTTQDDQREIVRLTCRTPSGLRTTASMPNSVRKGYISAFGSPSKFRKNFNEALRESDAVMQDRVLTRSMAVRLILDKRLGR